MSEYAVAQYRRDRRAERRPMSLAARSAPLRHHVVRCQRVDGARRGRPDHQRARRVGAGLARGALPRAAGARHVRARRRARGRARRHARLRAPGREANGVRRGAGHDDHRARRRPGKAYEPTAGSSGRRSTRSTRPASTPRPPTADGSWSRRIPSTPALFYNVACCESLAGRTADALEHLGRAIELSERFRAIAEGDSTSIRSATSPGSRS